MRTFDNGSILIAVEGIDGAGKTTQVQLLREALERVGETVVTSKEPTNWTLGKNHQNRRVAADFQQKKSLISS